MLQSHSLMQKVNSIFNNYMFFYKLIFILGKAVMQNFSLTKAANHIFRIGDQQETRAQKAGIDFCTTRTSECQDYPQLALFPYPVQSLLVEQHKIARKKLWKVKNRKKMQEMILFVRWTVYVIANISSYTSIYGIIVSLHYYFRVQTWLDGLPYLKMAVFRSMKQLPRSTWKMKYMISLEDLIEVR